MVANRKDLSLPRKIELIEYASGSKASCRDVAKKFKVSIGSVSNILKKKEHYINMWGENANKERVKEKRASKFEEVNSAVWEWFVHVRGMGLPITGPLIQGKAKEIAVGMEADGFKASNGWLEAFQKRHNVSLRAISGESHDVDSATVEQWLERLPGLLKDFDAKNVFNCDETGLCFKALPDKTLAVKKDDCKGGRLSKERLTVLLCASALGEKLKPLVIGKYKRPRAFGRQNIEKFPVTWKANRSAWMTAELFGNWLRALNVSMIQQNRHIALLLDNAPCHCFLGQLSNVRLVFLPPNTTSKTQPLDHGIIRSFKLHYRRHFMGQLLLQIDRYGGLNPTVKMVNVLHAIGWISDAWDEVGTACIQNCFDGCGVRISSLPSSTIENSSELLVDAELNELGHQLMLSGDIVKHSYDDNDIPTCRGPDDLEVRRDSDANLISPTPENDEENEPEPDTVEKPNLSFSVADTMLEELISFAMEECPRFQPHLEKVKKGFIEEFYNRKVKRQRKVTEFMDS
jgi:hypothetical protein